MKRTLLYLLTLWLALHALAGCDGEEHEGEFVARPTQGVLIVGLQTEPRTMDVGHLALYLFQADGTPAARYDYDDPRQLASEYHTLAAGSYILVVVAGCPQEELPAEAALPELVLWLNERADADSTVLSAAETFHMAEDGITRLLLTLRAGKSAVMLQPVRLLLTAPELQMPDYVPSRHSRQTASARRLRAVADVLAAGTEQCLQRQEVLCEQLEDGRYLVTLYLPAGGYDVRIWSDYSLDGTVSSPYYDASSLTGVQLVTEGYAPDDPEATKDAFYATASFSVAAQALDVDVPLIRPFARYRIVATDLEAYERARLAQPDLPPVERIVAHVSYENYFPTAFNVATGKPNDALTGVAYHDSLTVAQGFDARTARQVGSDFILTNGGDSFVTATLELLDAQTGKVLARVPGVRIDYRRGYLTTLTGAFLTAGQSAGGVSIDTRWDEIIITF